jgi:HEAT repeat protein/energy-coupling factor transporter ATP-binding protein EcfA2
MSVDANRTSVEVFYSYAHADEELRDGLEKQLSAMKRQGLITNWYDRVITGGSCWSEKINTHLDSAAIILLLVSPDFMSSDYCYSIEMKRALERHQLGEVRVVPIILRPTDWQHAPFAKLQAYPTNGRPITNWRQRDDAFLNIAQGLRMVVEELQAQQLSKSTRDEVYRQYCQSLYEHWWVLDFKGIMHIDMNRPMSIPLLEIFVPPAVLIGVPEYETVEREDIPEHFQMRPLKRGSDDSDDEVALMSIERLPQRERIHRHEQRITLHREAIQNVLEMHRRLVLLGDPGSGKSTFLRYLMLLLTQGQETFLHAFPQLASDLPAIPLYIPLATYADIWSKSSAGERSLLHFLPKYLSENYLDSYVGFLQQELVHGRIFVLLDGLDEIPDASLRIQIVRQVEAFTQTFPKNRFLVTSRIVGYREAPLAADYQVYTLADFDHEQIQSFIQQWCPAYERWVKGMTDNKQLQFLATSEAEKIFQAIKRKPAVGKLTVNPLLLTIVALIQRQGIELPSHRIELFDLCAMTLIDTWVKAKGIKTTPTFSRNNLIKLLCPLAFWMHQHPAISAIPEEELIEQIVHQLLARKITRYEDEAARLAEEFLDIVRGKTGILIERGKKRYGFLHLAFEEYFAARELEIREGRDEFIKVHLHEARWREVILLTVGSIGILHSNEKSATNVVQHVILDAGSRYEKWLHRDLLFAGTCLADDVGVSIECEEQILEQILYLYLTSPYDVLRTAIDGVISQWSGMYLASKVAKLLLCLLQKRGLGVDIPLRGVRISAPEILHLTQKLEDYCNQKVQERHKELMSLVCGMCYALSTLPARSQEGKQLLLNLLTSELAGIRQLAVSFLAQVKINHEEVIMSLLPLIADKNSQVRQIVAQALGLVDQADKRVIASLLQLVDDDQQDVRQAAVFALAQVGQKDEQVKQKLLQILHEPLMTAKLMAISALTQFGQCDSEVVDALFKALWDENVISVKVAALTGLGRLEQNFPEVLPVLFSLIAHDDIQMRTAVAQALGQLGQTRSEIVDRLLGRATDENWQIRQTIAMALGYCKGAACIQALVELLADSDLEVQQAAIQSLARLGQDVPSAIDSLLGLLASPVITLRQEAIQALGKLGQGNHRVVNTLLRLCTDANVLIRCAAVDALGWVRQQDNLLLTPLLAALSDTSPQVRWAGVNALKRLKIAGEQVIDALLELLADNDVSIRKAAIAALGEVGQNKAEVLTTFFQLIFEDMLDEIGEKEEIYNIRDKSIKLAEIVTQAFVLPKQGYAEVISALSILLRETYQNENPNSQQPLLDTLKQLTDEQREILLSFLSALLSESTFLNESWKELAHEIIQAIQGLIGDILRDLDTTLLKRLLGMLKALGYYPLEIVPVLLSFLADQRWQLRLATVQILMQIERDEPEVIEALRKLCSDGSVSVRLAAIQLLENIGRGHSQVTEDLIALLADKSWLVRKAVVQALGQREESYANLYVQLRLHIFGEHLELREAAIISLIQLEQDETRAMKLFIDVLSPLSSFCTREKVQQAVRLALVRLQNMNKIQAQKSFLLELFHDQNADWHQRYASALLLGYIGKEQTEIYFQLLEALPQVPSLVKPSIILALSEIGQEHQKVVDALLKLTTETDRNIKQALAQTFGRLGVVQPEITTFLYNLLSDANAKVRQSAVEALAQLEQDEPQVIVKLLKMLTDITFAIRQAAVIALGTIGEGGPEVVNSLLKCLFEPPLGLKAAAITALGQINSGQTQVVEALLRVIVSGDFTLVRQATETLVSLPINRRRVIEQLEQLLHYYEPLTSEHVQDGGAVNYLLFALQQMVD